MEGISEFAAMPSAQTFAAACALLALPCVLAAARLRMRVALAEMALVMTVSQLRGLGDVAMLAKVCTGFAVLLVAWAAAYHPAAKRRLGALSWLHLAAAAGSLACVLTVDDRALALPVRVQWCAMVAAALLVCRTIRDQRSLEEVLAGLLAGLAASTAMALSPLALDPAMAFNVGFGRFSPYECNPNQISVMFALTAPLALYFAVAGRRPVVRHGAALVALAAATGVVLTVSRMGLVTVTVSCLPCLVRSARRPAIAVTLIVVGALCVDQLQRAHAEDASFDHLDITSQVARLELIEAAMEEVYERPWFGLATSRHAYAYDDLLNAHNAYVEMLYLGGVAYAAPLFLVLAYSATCAFGTWRLRKQSPYDPLLVSTLAALLAASIANGFINNIIHYPTYSWAFAHVLLCHAFIYLRRDAAAAAPAASGVAPVAIPRPLRVGVARPPRPLPAWNLHSGRTQW